MTKYTEVVKMIIRDAKYTDAILTQAAQTSVFYDALTVVIDTIDPLQVHDLRGEAALFFSGTYEYPGEGIDWVEASIEEVWPKLAPTRRKEMLKWFFDSVENDVLVDEEQHDRTDRA